MRNSILTIFFSLCSNLFFAQTPIKFKNPSFESEPSVSIAPEKWVPCGMLGETPSDVQPGQFGCAIPAAHGATYLGMVVRDNFTWESVSQKLSSPLDSGVCYSFTVQLAASPIYVSVSRTSGLAINYVAPTVFQLWGGYGDCNSTVLLAESPPIGHQKWKKYRFVMRHVQSKPITHLTIHAYYRPGDRCKSAAGNLLVDDLSDIVLAECPTNMIDSTPSRPVNILPVLESERDFDAILSRELASVKYYTRQEVEFVMQCDENRNGRVDFYNIHLSNVAAALSQYRDRKLILRIKNVKAAVRGQRVDYLKNYLLLAGASESQIDVKPFDKDEKGPWKVNTSWLSARW